MSWAASAASLSGAFSGPAPTKAALPNCTTCPSHRPLRPCSWEVTSETKMGAIWLALAARRISTAITWSTCCSIPAATPKTVSSGKGAKRTIVCNCQLPRVRVPVLSKTTVSIRWARSKAANSWTRIPLRAARVTPATRARGTATPRAQGQEMTRTVRPRTKAASKAAPRIRSTRAVAAASNTMTGTKIRSKRSVRPSTVILRLNAPSMMRSIWPSMASGPTFSACTRKFPSTTHVPLTSRSPIVLGSGRASPSGTRRPPDPVLASPNRRRAVSPLPPPGTSRRLAAFQRQHTGLCHWCRCKA